MRRAFFFVAFFFFFFFFVLLPVGSGGMRAPSRRAWLRPIAIACLRLFTTGPLRPEWSSGSWKVPPASPFWALEVS